MKYTLKNKEIELTQEEVNEIIKQNTSPIEEKKVGIAIKNRFTGEVIFQSTKTTWKEAVEEGGTDLYGADLRGAEMQNAKFYGKGGTTKIKKSQLDDFLKALGVVMED